MFAMITLLSFISGILLIILGPNLTVLIMSVTFWMTNRFLNPVFNFFGKTETQLGDEIEIKSSNTPIKIKFYIGNKPLNGKLDTGISVNVMSLMAIKENNINVESFENFNVEENKTSDPVKYGKRIPILYNLNGYIKIPFYIVDTPDSKILFGRQILKKGGLSIKYEDHVFKVESRKHNMKNAYFKNLSFQLSPYEKNELKGTYLNTDPSCTYKILTRKMADVVIMPDSVKVNNPIYVRNLTDKTVSFKQGNFPISLAECKKAGSHAQLKNMINNILISFKIFSAEVMELLGFLRVNLGIPKELNSKKSKINWKRLKNKYKKKSNLFISSSE